MPKQLFKISKTNNSLQEQELSAKLLENSQMLLTIVRTWTTTSRHSKTTERNLLILVDSQRRSPRIGSSTTSNSQMTLLWKNLIGLRVTTSMPVKRLVLQLKFLFHISPI